VRELERTVGRGLGLRAQILFALGFAFIVAFSLLAIIAAQLFERARTLDRVDGARATARAIAAAVDREGADAFAPLADAAIGHGGVAGVELAWEGLEPMARGIAGSGEVATAPLSGGGEVRVWLRASSSDEAPVRNLLLFYMALTGGVILILAYVALTYLIVRPVSEVTLASERLASGNMTATVPIRGAGEVARLALSFNRMAAQLRADREELERRLNALERTTKELATAQDQVVRSERLASVGKLSAGVAHEIGNPLAAILGLLELARSPDLDAAERADFLKRIHDETERIHSIIRNLLDFARREEDASEARASLGAVIDDAVKLVKPQKNARNVRIEREIAEDLPEVRGAHDQLLQLVVNLLLNAADAMNGEGTVRVRAVVEGDRAVLTVTDEGPGIDPEILPHVFEPFVTSKPPGHGTGLGLAVSNTIVERAGGSMRAENVSGGGARFTISLARAR
jgi:C4-dicarboxylate-specific signal transduction histidine kinase